MFQRREGLSEVWFLMGLCCLACARMTLPLKKIGRKYSLSLSLIFSKGGVDCRRASVARSPNLNPCHITSDIISYTATCLYVYILNNEPKITPQLNGKLILRVSPDPRNEVSTKAHTLYLFWSTLGDPVPSVF